MNAATQSLGLWNLTQDAPIPLEATEVDAELLDLSSRVTLRQRYRNQEACVIEAVYSFPLPVDAVLLAFSVRLGERTLTGVVQPRGQAQESYEEAITDGQTSILLEQLEPGLYSVSLGNLGPGETAEISLRYALLHRVQGDQVRWHLPTVLAPRYGAAPHPPHQVPEARLDVAHGLSLQVHIRGLLQQAELTCPSHATQVEQLAEETLVRVADGAWLDRDLVLNFELPAEGTAQANAGTRVGAHCEPDLDGGYALLASFCPHLPTTPAEAERGRVIKLLVDCSGSMGGVAIAQARRALQQILDALRPQDRVALVRFGSHIDAVVDAPIPPDGPAMARLRAAVDRLDADLGGTEIFTALRHTLDMPANAEQADLILITDGEVWDSTGSDAQTRRLIDQAKRGGQRIFSVGVGSAVSERLVRELAEGTGGAWELVGPNEGMAAVIERQFERIYAARAADVRIDWPQQPLWASLPKTLFGGDTLHLFARFAAAPIGPITLSARLDDGGCLEQTVGITAAPATDAEAQTPSQTLTESPSDLARLAASAQLAGLDEPAARTALAVRYQLICDETAYLIVDRSADTAKGDGLPALRQVPSMLAAGWGATAACMEASSAMPPPQPRALRTFAASRGSDVQYSMCASEADFSFDEPEPVFDAPESLCTRLNAIAGATDAQAQWPDSLLELRRLGADAATLDALADLLADGWDEAAIVALWLDALARGPDGSGLNRQARRLIRLRLKPLAQLPRRAVLEEAIAALFA